MQCSNKNVKYLKQLPSAYLSTHTGRIHSLITMKRYGSNEDIPHRSPAVGREMTDGPSYHADEATLPTGCLKLITKSSRIH